MSTSGKPRARRARRLKVYSIDLFVSGHSSATVSEQCRVTVAAYSQKEAAVLVGVSAYYFGAWGGVTANDHDVEVAMGEPGTIFSKPLDDVKGELRRTVLERNSLHTLAWRTSGQTTEEKL